MAPNPIIGAWVLDTDTSDTADASSVIVFGADGTVVESDVGAQESGVWEAMGPDQVAVTLRGYQGDDPGAVSSVTIRATVTVAADGQSFTAPYTLEFGQPDGT